MRRYSVLFLLFISLIVTASCSNGEQEATETQGTEDTQTEVSSNEKSDDSADESAVDVSGDTEDRLVKYFKNKFGSRLPQDTAVSVSGFESADIPGFDKGNFDVDLSGRGSQQIPFLISEDKKYVIIGVDSATDISAFEKSPVPGYRQGEVQYGNRALPVLVSDDGKNMIIGELLDSSVDPLKMVMDDISLENVPVKGNENAAVKIVEYSDFQCPFCKRGSEMLPDLLDQYGDDIAIYYKQLPLPNHNWAKDASVASICAYQQGNDKFWSFHDKIFENQSQIKRDNANEKFATYAKEVGLDTAKFESCIESQEVTARVEQEMQEAQQLGVNSTPTFVVDGIIVPGADINAVKSAIDRRLEGK